MRDEVAALTAEISRFMSGRPNGVLMYNSVLSPVRNSSYWFGGQVVRRPTADRQIPRSNRGRTSYFFFTFQSPTDEHRLPPTADRPTADRRHRPPPTTPSSRPPTFTIAAVVARRLLLRRRPTARPPPDRPNDRPTEPPRRRHCRRRRDHPQPVKNRDSVCNHEPACRIFLVPRVSTFFVSTHTTTLHSLEPRNS